MMEQGNFKRIKYGALSGGMQRIILLTERGSKLNGVVDDASHEGVGITILQKPRDFDVGSHVTLTSDNGEFYLLGEVVYVIEESAVKYRVGIAFRNARALHHYEKLLENFFFGPFHI
jgi:hypothetical protein